MCPLTHWQSFKIKVLTQHECIKQYITLEIEYILLNILFSICIRYQFYSVFLICYHYLKLSSAESKMQAPRRIVS